MDRILICAIIIWFNLPSFGQVEGKILREFIEYDKNKIVSIIEYSYTISVQDTFKINRNTVDSILPKYAEYYNEKGNLSRKEYYNKKGEIRSAYDNYFKNDTLIYELGDTLYNNVFVRKDYEYLENYSVKSKSLNRKGDTTWHIFNKDIEKNTTAEYFLGQEMDTLLTIFHYYDLNNKYRAIEKIDNDKVRSMGFYHLDDQDRYYKWFYIGTSGSIISEETFSYPDNNTTKRNKLNLIDSTSTYSTQIKFNDDRGNTYKTYWNSSYSKSIWKVKYFKINYRKD